MPIEVGSSVRIKASGQNGRVVGISDSSVTVRLSLNKDVPAVDWAYYDFDDVELVEAPATAS